jgi:choline dehydrogenase-like flavoprotein
VETFHGNDPKGVHGTDGPIHISVGTKLATRCQDTFIKAAASQGFEETADTANLESGNAVGRAKRFISADGIRRDTAHRYLHPRLQGGERPNLHVLVETRVIRVLLDGEKASGVMFQSAEGAEAEPRAVKANKMVVLSSGACGTPPVLERSGIGSHEVLKRANVPLVVDLPGVGDGYQDHNTMTYIYRSNLTPDETLDGMVTGTFDIPSMLQNRDDRVGWNCVDGNGKIRPNNVDVAGLGPDFQKLWDQEYKDKPDRPLAFMTLALW